MHLTYQTRKKNCNMFQRECKNGRLLGGQAALIFGQSGHHTLVSRTMDFLFSSENTMELNFEQTCHKLTNTLLILSVSCHKETTTGDSHIKGLIIHGTTVCLEIRALSKLLLEMKPLSNPSPFMPPDTSASAPATSSGCSW